MIPPLGVPVWKNTTASAPSGPLRSISILRPPTSRVSRTKPLSVGEVVGVDLREVLPLVRQLIVREDRVDRTFLDAGVAVDALLGIDEQLLHFGKAGLVFSRVNTVDRADLHTTEILEGEA